MTILRVEKLSKTFGALKALDAVSFELKQNEILGIAGSNGSGKSTLFNVLTGIPFGPDSGTVELDGKSIKGLAPHEIAVRGLTRTFQTETVFDSLSVRQNVEVASRNGGKAVRDDDVSAVLTLCEIDPVLWCLHAGAVPVFEKKKIMIASALAMRPKVLLLDEPAAGLTKPEITQTASLIAKIRDGGVAVVLIEHVLGLLLKLSDRLMVMNEGRHILTGGPAEVMADERVIASYLGARAGND